MKKHNFSPSQPLSPNRQSKQGAVIVIVLGLLVVLALVGVAFQYLVMNEYRAAKNWQTRYRARSLAEDGFAVAMARLRIAPTLQHWEGEGEWAYMSRRDVPETLDSYLRINPKGTNNDPMKPDGTAGVEKVEKEFAAIYLKNVRLGKGDQNNRVSYSKRSPNGTNADQKSDDANWVDANGNGTKDTAETLLGADLLTQTRDPLRGVSYFKGDGIELAMRTPAIRAGTFRELGDRARLKIIDTNSQFNINDYQGAQLQYMLRVLGSEISNLIQGADGVPTGAATNLFTPQVVDTLVNFKEAKVSKRIEDKREIRKIMETFLPTQFSERIFDFTMDFISINSWPLLGSGEGQIARYDIARNPAIERPTNTSLYLETWLDDHKEPAEDDSNSIKSDYSYHLGRYQGTDVESGNSYDGLPGILPQVSVISRAPINVNTVSLPVLTTMIAGIEADARFIMLPRQGLGGDGKANEVFFTDNFTKFQTSRGLQTDLGRQPFLDQGNRPIDNQSGHLLVVPQTQQSTIGNLAPYQEVVIGPMGYVDQGSTGGVVPLWKDAGSGDGVANDVRNPVNRQGNEAQELARMIILERDTHGPFLSWMDFDYRVFHELLLNFKNSKGTDGTFGPQGFPDLVDGGNGRAWAADSINNFAVSDVSKAIPKYEQLIASHPAALVTDGNKNHSYTPGGFKTWYHRSVVDMLRANFNPNGFYNKKNPESAMYTTVDATDLRYQTAPVCFSSKGVFEITSQGEVAALRPDINTGELRDQAVAQRTYRGVVEIYRTLEHTTQKDFLTTYSSIDGKSAVVHSLRGTSVGPNSIDFSIFDYEKDIDLKNYQRRASIDTNAIATSDSRTVRTPNLDGYFSPAAADPDRGYVTLYPQDRTPVNFLRPQTGGAVTGGILNFYAPFNTSLAARPRRLLDPATIPDGASVSPPDSGRVLGGDGTAIINPEPPEGYANTGKGNLHPSGHLPVSRSDRNLIMGMWNSDLEIARRDATLRALWASTSTVTPDPLARNFGTDPKDLWKGFEEASNKSSAFSARYANLRPDGVLMRGWDLSPAFWPADESGLDGVGVSRIGRVGAKISGAHSYARGPYAVNRLAILRYRCGGVSDSTPFSPISGIQPQRADVRYNAPSRANGDPETDLRNIARRCFGEEAGWGSTASRGLDEHNVKYQGSRQADTNFPYYQGWIDFWIKWELPPQGGTQDPGQPGRMISAGDLDPGSANFSGLIGATQFGRFSESVTDERGDGVDWLRYNKDVAGARDLDFEGSSFFLYKESGGFLRVSQSYFSWAYFSNPPSNFGADDSTLFQTYGGAQYTQIGNNYRTLGKPLNTGSGDEVDIEGEYIYTNDIRSLSSPEDLGFAWARQESRVDLSALVDLGEPTGPIVLAPHNWYRFTMSYRSNVESGKAHAFYIDGKKIPEAMVGTLQKGAWVSGNQNTGSGKNTGEAYSENGGPATFSLVLTENPVTYLIQRSTSKSVEVDPEDRLTIGCIFRRQYGPALRSAIEDIKSGGSNDERAPVFYLDRTIVAVANATLDDVRIAPYTNPLSQEELYDSVAAAGYSRYSKLTAPLNDPTTKTGGDGSSGAKGEGYETLGRYENGFVALQPGITIKSGASGRINFQAPYNLPVQIGSISWTEYRPWWDSYNNRRVDLSEESWAKAPSVAMGYKVYDDLQAAVRDRGVYDTKSAPLAMNGTDRKQNDFWLAGGYALTRAGKEDPVYIDNSKDKQNPSPADKRSFFKYQAHFLVDKKSEPDKAPWGVLNSTAVLDDVSITLMTPARILTFEEIEE